ncbi:MAG: hypothetical protein ACTHJM_15915 [Marmoricola sp.]
MTPVKVGTSHGELEFSYRDVEVFDAAGTAVARFTCEDTPEDFDANVARAGFVRRGFDRETGNVLLEKSTGDAKRQVAAPERSAGEAAASLAGNLMKLAWMAVLFIVLVVVLFGCAAALFGHH